MNAKSTLPESIWLRSRSEPSPGIRSRSIPASSKKPFALPHRIAHDVALITKSSWTGTLVIAIGVADAACDAGASEAALGGGAALSAPAGLDVAPPELQAPTTTMMLSASAAGVSDRCLIVMNLLLAPLRHAIEPHRTLTDRPPGWRQSVMRCLQCQSDCPQPNPQ